MDKKNNKNLKSKSKSKSKEKATTNINKKPKIKKVITNIKKVVNTKKNPKSKSEKKTKGKSKAKKGKKSISKKKSIKNIIEDNNINNAINININNIKENTSNNENTIMITQKNDKNLKNYKKEKKPIIKIEKKIFVDTKIGTPHYDEIPKLKKLINEKDNLINDLTIQRKNMHEKIKIVYDKLNSFEKTLEETPEQKDKTKYLYFILNLSKKDFEISKSVKNKYEQEYLNLFSKNNYNPIEKLKLINKKINISKNDNNKIVKLIGEIKNKNLSDRKIIKNFSYKGNIIEINNLLNELSSLNNKKHEIITQIKNNKKHIKSYIAKLENLSKLNDDNKINNKDSEQNILKVEKDINILKKYLLMEDENELFQLVYNDEIPMIKNNIHIFKLKLSRNHSSISNKISPDKKDKNLDKNKSTESKKSILEYSNDYFKESNKFITNKKFSNQNKLFPLISRTNEKNNKSQTIFPKANKSNNDNIKITINKNKSMGKILFNEEESADIKKNEINYDEIIFKKEYYNIINKKLEISIQDKGLMYKKRKEQIEQLVNISKEKLLEIKHKNSLLENEITNLHKILHLKVKQFIDFTEKNNKKFSSNNNSNTNISNIS